MFSRHESSRSTSTMSSLFTTIGERERGTLLQHYPVKEQARVGRIEHRQLSTPGKYWSMSDSGVLHARSTRDVADPDPFGTYFADAARTSEGVAP
jgi:hypothetical protein